MLMILLVQYFFIGFMLVSHHVSIFCLPICHFRGADIIFTHPNHVCTLNYAFPIKFPLGLLLYPTFVGQIPGSLIQNTFFTCVNSIVIVSCIIPQYPHWTTMARYVCRNHHFCWRWNRLDTVDPSGSRVTSLWPGIMVNVREVSQFLLIWSHYYGNS